MKRWMMGGMGWGLFVGLLIPFQGFAFQFYTPPPESATNAFVLAATETLPGESFVIGHMVDIQAASERDIFLLASQEAAWSGKADGDVWMAATKFVDCSGTAKDDVRIFSTGAEVSAEIAGDLFLFASGAGQLARNAVVHGDAFLLGSTLLAEGNVNGNAILRGQQVTLAGHWGGNVRIFARKLLISPDTHIAGDLTYTTSSPFVLPDSVKVDGTVTAKATDKSATSSETFQKSLLWNGSLFMSALLVGFCLLTAFPRATAFAVRNIRVRFFISLLIGTGVLLFTPILILFFFMLGFGIPLALILLGLYLILLYIAHILGALWLGTLLVRQPPQAQPTLMKVVTALVVGLLVTYFINSIPGMNGAFLFLLTLLGTGAGVQAIRQTPVIVQIPSSRIPPPPPAEDDPSSKTPPPSA